MKTFFEHMAENQHLNEQQNTNSENAPSHEGCLETRSFSGAEAQAENGSDGLDLAEADEVIGAAALEAGARSIAATKRGVRPDDPAVDKVWTSYVGHARKAYIAMVRAMQP